jgi:hypothetical protein
MLYGQERPLQKKMMTMTTTTKVSPKGKGRKQMKSRKIWGTLLR